MVFWFAVRVVYCVFLPSKYPKVHKDSLVRSGIWEASPSILRLEQWRGDNGGGIGAPARRGYKGGLSRPRSGDPNNPAHVKHEMPAAEPADPVRAKAEAVERLGDESPAMTNPTKSLDDTLAVRAHKGCHQAEHKGRRDS